ncbi:MAG: type II secretion system protein [Candidatus Omnitrophota bacterium]
MNNSRDCRINVAKNACGFTLVEVLLAIAIFGIISGAIFAVFTRSIAVWETARIKANHKEKALFFLMSFEKELKNHIDTGNVQFIVEENKIYFTTLKDTIYNVLYVFDKASGQFYRYRSVYPIPPASVKPVVVLKNVVSCGFSCEYPLLAPGQDAQKNSSLPCMVTVKFSVDDVKTKNNYALSRVISIP